MTVEDLVSPFKEDKPIRRANLSRLLRRSQRPHVCAATLRTTQIDPQQLDKPLPSPAQQIDDLIQWLALSQPAAGIAATFRSEEICAWLGMPINTSDRRAPLFWLLKEPETQSLIRGAKDIGPDGVAIQLTMQGWQRYEELQRGVTSSRLAFMAMKFGDADMNSVLSGCLRPAVEAAGFELRTLVDDQPAGLIDDQLRVSLRSAKFVIADLTHKNPGAYWEAGFAEGLGKHVIYTCNASVWEKERTHFDTNHMATIIWDLADLNAAKSKLVAMIRATFPEEAKLS